MTEQLLFGQYRIESTIGAGGMAIVYKAHHISLDKHFAIKKLSDSLAQSAEAKERFIREARTHSRLEHPNIVKFHDILQDHASGNVYIVMEYVEGRTLAKMIGRETGPIPFEKAWPIFRQMLEGIGYAHSQGVVHRDIKPGNIIVTTDNKVKILDFGIARDETGHTITQSGQVVGTLQYASPEQIKGERVDQRSDIYNLGMTLYEMVAGRLPHDINPNSSSFHIMQRMLNDDVPDPRTFYPHIPENVVAAIFKAIERDVSRRFSSVGDFIQVLDGRVDLDLSKLHTVGTAQGVESVKINENSIESEYKKLLDLSKMFSQFIVRQHNGNIELVNRVDGKKVVRGWLIAAMVYLGLSIFGNFVSLFTAREGKAFILFFMILFGGLFWWALSGYKKRKYYEESLSINSDHIFVSKIDDPSTRTFNYKEISGVFERNDIRGIQIRTTNIHEEGYHLFQNSNKGLLKYLAPILDDIVKMKQKQLHKAS